MGAPDRRAVKALLNAYWSSEGWRSVRDLSQVDLDHAVRAGVMVGRPSSLTHDELIGDVGTALQAVSIQEAANCFLASLTVSARGGSRKTRVALGPGMVAGFFAAALLPV